MDTYRPLVDPANVPMNFPVSQSKSVNDSDLVISAPAEFSELLTGHSEPVDDTNTVIDTLYPGVNVASPVATINHPSTLVDDSADNKSPHKSKLPHEFTPEQASKMKRDRINTLAETAARQIFRRFRDDGLETYGVEDYPLEPEFPRGLIGLAALKILLEKITERRGLNFEDVAQRWFVRSAIFPHASFEDTVAEPVRFTYNKEAMEEFFLTLPTPTDPVDVEVLDFGFFTSSDRGSRNVQTVGQPLLVFVNGRIQGRPDFHARRKEIAWPAKISTGCIGFGANFVHHENSYSWINVDAVQWRMRSGMPAELKTLAHITIPIIHQPHKPEYHVLESNKTAKLVELQASECGLRSVVYKLRGQVCYSIDSFVEVVFS